MDLGSTVLTLAFINNISPLTILLILVVCLILFGRRLPEVGKSFGKTIVEFKKGLSSVSEEVATGPVSPPQNNWQRPPDSAYPPAGGAAYQNLPPGQAAPDGYPAQAYPQQGAYAPPQSAPYPAAPQYGQPSGYPAQSGYAPPNPYPPQSGNYPQPNVYGQPQQMGQPPQPPAQGGPPRGYVGAPAGPVGPAGTVGRHEVG